MCIANWKEELSSKEQVALAHDYAMIDLPSHIDGWVLPRAEVREEVARVLMGTPWQVGAQAWAPGCEGVCGLTLVGHGSRREHEGSSERVAQARAAVAAGARVVVCVGERAGENREEILAQQIAELADVCPHGTVIAYEPLWAIGGSAPLLGDELARALLAVRQIVARVSPRCSSVLYGGSVMSEHVLAVRDAGADGLLIGRASWSNASWNALVKQAHLW